MDGKPRLEGFMVVHPRTISPDATLSDALKLMRDYGISGMPVVLGGGDGVPGQLVGILTYRDVRFATDPRQKVSELMTHEGLVTVRENVTRNEARRMLHQHRVEKLLVVDEHYRCVGLVTVRDLVDEAAYGDVPRPIENLPSAYSFSWSTRGALEANSDPNWLPVFPFEGSEEEHQQRLNASRTLARDASSDLVAARYNVRQEYSDGFCRYLERLPERPGSGSFLMADAEARNLRWLFAHEASSIPIGLASKLRVFLEHHIALRAYYPESERFYRDVQSGRLEKPLPLDAVSGLLEGIRANSPTVFANSVGVALETATHPLPASEGRETREPSIDDSIPGPPKDPLGELDPRKAHDFVLAGLTNKLWQSFLRGEKVAKAVDGWGRAYETLSPHVAPILEWLRSFIHSNMPPTPPPTTTV